MPTRAAHDRVLRRRRLAVRDLPLGELDDVRPTVAASRAACATDGDSSSSSSCATDAAHDVAVDEQRAAPPRRRLDGEMDGDRRPAGRAGGTPHHDEPTRHPIAREPRSGGGRRAEAQSRTRASSVGPPRSSTPITPRPSRRRPPAPDGDDLDACARGASGRDHGRASRRRGVEHHRAGPVAQRGPEELAVIDATSDDADPRARVAAGRAASGSSQLAPPAQTMTGMLVGHRSESASNRSRPRPSSAPCARTTSRSPLRAANATAIAASGSTASVSAVTHALLLTEQTVGPRDAAHRRAPCHGQRPGDVGPLVERRVDVDPVAGTDRAAERVLGCDRDRHVTTRRHRPPEARRSGSRRRRAPASAGPARSVRAAIRPLEARDHARDACTSASARSLAGEHVAGVEIGRGHEHRGTRAPGRGPGGAHRRPRPRPARSR